MSEKKKPEEKKIELTQEELDQLIEKATATPGVVPKSTEQLPTSEEIGELAKITKLMREVVKREDLNAQEKKLQIAQMLKAQMEQQAGHQRKVRFTTPPGMISDLDPGLTLDQLHQRKSDDPMIQNWQRECDCLYLLHNMRRAAVMRDPTYEYYGIKSLGQFSRVGQLTSQLGMALKASTTPLNATTATEGPEWIPTGFSAEVLEFYRLALKVAALFREIPMSSNPFKLPIVTTRPSAIASAETTAKPADIYAGATLSTPDTGARTFTAKRFYTWMAVTGTLQEEAIVAMMPFIQKEIMLAMADALENGLLSGDTNATHMDSDIDALAVTDIRRQWLGPRGYALDVDGAGGSGSTALAGIATAASIQAARKLMGPHGVNPDELAVITGPWAYADLIIDTAVKTVDVYGPKATILTGELAKVYGIPIIVSGFCREDLQVGGYYDGVTTNNTTMALVNRTRGMWGRFARMTAEPFRDPFNDLDSLITADWKAWEWSEAAASTTTTVHLVRDVTAA